MIRLGQFLFRFRNWLFPTVLLVAVAFGTPRYPLGDAGLDRIMDAFGILVTLLGQGVRAITIGYEYIVRGGRHRQVYADGLVTGGVYAHVRNPMYLGNGLMMLGIALILHATVFYVVCLPLVVLAYAAIIAAEEDFLRRKFGSEFGEYCRRVPSLVPRLTGFRHSVEGMRFNWRRLIVKEYGTILMTLLGIVLMTLWDEYRIVGPEALPPAEEIALRIAPLVILFIVVWALKKTRRLSADQPDRHSAA